MAAHLLGTYCGNCMGRACHWHYFYIQQNQSNVLAHLLHTSSSANGYKVSENVSDYYQLLNVSDKSSIVEVKEAYFKLAKIYHPDSKSRQANANKFNQIQVAYNAICMHIEKMEKRGRRAELEEYTEGHDDSAGTDRFSARHTAPQHRQYLEYEGIGFGTPSQREKQFQKYRAMRAADTVSTHRIYKIAVTDETGLVLKDKKAARKIRTTNVIERLVEDLVQDSMAKGEFDDLPGKGKPLPPKTNYCPYVDLSTHNLNKVLVNNGYVPEWIQLEKEIRNMLSDAKAKLLHERIKLGWDPLNDFNEKKWAGLLIEFEESVRDINKKVNDLNLVVPIIRLQMMHFRAEKESAKVIDDYSELQVIEEERRDRQETEDVMVPNAVGVLAEKLALRMSRLLGRLGSLIIDRMTYRNEKEVKG